MNPEEVKSYFGAVKNPVCVHLSDGRKFVVEHLDYLLFPPVGQTAFLFNNVGGYIVINRQEIVSLEERTP